MFDSLRKLFSRKPPPERAIELARQPFPEQGRAVEESGAARENSTFICHEAFLGRDQRIVGYEFAHPQSLPSRMREKNARIRHYYDDALLRHLSALQIESLLGARLAFVEISPDSLAHPMLARLPKKNLAILLSFAETPEQADAEVTDSAAAALDVLRVQGVHVGLKWRRKSSREGAGYLPWVDFIQIPWQEYAGDAAERVLPEEIAALRYRAKYEGESKRGSPAPMRLIAGDLRNPDDFTLCYRLGFDFFRGPFVNSREQWTPPQSSINRLRVVQLLNAIRHDADTVHLAKELKQDPVLSYKLLRYINSAAIGLRNEIKTLDQAVAILGRENLYRWLSVLMFNMRDPGYREWAFTEQALARAALMERLGNEARRQNEKQSPAPDALFLTGLFSLLDQLLGEPLPELTSKIQLPEEISLALIKRRGPLAGFLTLAEACETQDPEAIAAYAKPLKFSAAAVSHAVFDALTWAHEMTEVSAS
ncbi:MAG: HDOD domain-containing protein [Betaproteobacteria bacterium]|nr:HDOD domain-containing protein [Betaproteobacteria bacterium]